MACNVSSCLPDISPKARTIVMRIMASDIEKTAMNPKSVHLACAPMVLVIHCESGVVI